MDCIDFLMQLIIMCIRISHKNLHSNIIIFLPSGLTQLPRLPRFWPAQASKDSTHFLVTLLLMWIMLKFDI